MFFIMGNSVQKHLVKTFFRSNFCLSLLVTNFILCLDTSHNFKFSVISWYDSKIDSEDSIEFSEAHFHR